MNETQKTLECLDCLKVAVDSRGRETILNFSDFLRMVQLEPQGVLRNIFQLFHDMVKSNVEKGEDEYPDDPESIGFVKYDCSRIFVVGMDNPFFPDRLLANRFVREVDDFRQGSQQNRMHIYDGPPGCGKSTFLNNLLQKFEEYAATKEGQSFEVIWQIKIGSNEVEVPCPSHDHPILILPKAYRVPILKKLLSDVPNEVREKIFCDKEYEWILRGEACTICASLFHALCNKLGSFDEVLDTIKVRPYRFNRRLGEGISIFNPGDKPLKEMYLGDKQIQEKLDQIFGVNQVRFVFSPLAKTNNGIYVLMDIKSHNIERLLELHNVISEGVHKVNGIEEKINSLFFALMNPEDIKTIEDKKVESFQARIRYSKISYVMEVATEAAVYRSIHGQQIDAYFLPRVLDNFARVIISTRMELRCEPLETWIPYSNLQRYNKRHYCDENGILLRMEVYGGIIPTWLSEEDKKKFTAQIRRDLIAFGEEEGEKGFSGRDSLRFFGQLINFYGPKSNEPKKSNSNLINMANVADYFKFKIDKESRSKISPNFISSLVDWYDYTVLNEVKEALYFYNKERIQKDILNYLCAVNYDSDGRKVQCQYTGEEIEVTPEFFKMVGSYITGQQMQEYEALKYARDIQKRYTEMIAREPGKKITETELYVNLFNSYVRNLKENALKPFVGNDNFREAIKAFGNEELFKTFDTRIREHVSYMIQNMIERFGYTVQGAKEICFYVLDQNLVSKFS